MTLLKIFVQTMRIMGKRCFLYLTGIFFMSSGWAMFSVMSSLLMKNVVDAAQTGDVVRMRQVIISNILVGILSMLVYRQACIVYNVEAKRAYGTLCRMLYAHEVRLPYSYYEEHHSGEFMSRLSYDLEKMGSIYGSRLRRTVAPLIQVVVFLVPMFYLSWQLTLCLVAVNMLMLLINGMFINPIQQISGVLSKTNSKMTEKLSNLLQGMEQARMYPSGKKTVQEFVEENKRYAKQSNRRIFLVAGLESCNTGFDLLCGLAFLMLGVYFVGEGYTSLGALTAIYSLYGNFSFQFLQLGRYLPELLGCLTNARNIFDFLETEREPENWYGLPDSEKRDRAVQSQSCVKFQDVDFSYREDKPLLKQLCMEIKEGESVAVVGSSGCGKTTLSKLLLSLYPVAAGDVFLQGVSYKEMSNARIRSLISYVPQEPYLFKGTIRENIRLGKVDATEEEIIQAAKVAYAHNFIMELEQGYDTQVGERGNRLSGGQRQRIAIARAVLKEAPVLLLDEATSALDNESEQLVNQAVKELHGQRTLIMIAHRPSTIALADRIFDLDAAKKENVPDMA